MLDVGMVPKVVAHMQPGARAIVVVQPGIALDPALVTLTETKGYPKRGS